MRILWWWSLILALSVPAAAEPLIAWYSTWREGAQEAQRSQRPILLVAAACQCHGVPGTW